MAKSTGNEASKRATEHRTYTVKLPFIYRGAEVKEGDEVELSHDQAERLKASGHI